MNGVFFSSFMHYFSRLEKHKIEPLMVDVEGNWLDDLSFGHCPFCFHIHAIVRNTKNYATVIDFSLIHSILGIIGWCYVKITLYFNAS
jgi:hypothetical protein